MLLPELDTGCINCAHGRQDYKSLSVDELGEINSHRTEILYKKGELLFKQGNYVSSIIFIRSGLVKVYVEHGSNSTFLLLKVSGTYLGLSSLFTDKFHHYSAMALSQTEVCQINFDTFSKVVENNNKFATDIIKSLNEDKINSYKRFVSLSHKQLHGRVAEFLLYLSDEVYKSNPFLFTLSKTELAGLVSSSKESLSRIFSELKRGGVIDEKSHHITIRDRDRLLRISENG